MKLRYMLLSLLLLAALALPAASAEAAVPKESTIAAADSTDSLSSTSCRWSHAQLMEVYNELSELVGTAGNPIVTLGLGSRGNGLNTDGAPCIHCIQVTITTLNGQEAAEAYADYLRAEYGDMVELSVGPYEISFTPGTDAPVLPQPFLPNRQSSSPFSWSLVPLLFLLVLFLAFPLRRMLLQPAGRPPVSDGARPMTRRRAAQAVRESGALPGPDVWTAIQRELDC